MTVLSEWLHGLPSRSNLHINTYHHLPSGHKIWVIAKHQLPEEVLGDIYADQWVEQALVSTPDHDPATQITNRFIANASIANDAFGIATDLECYLGHRTDILISLLHVVALDLGVPRDNPLYIKWDAIQFSGLLKYSANSGLKIYPNLLKFLSELPHQHKMVIATAFAIGAGHDGQSSQIPSR